MIGSADKIQPERLRKDIEAWIPYAGQEPLGWNETGDQMAVSYSGLLQPRRLAIVRRQGETDGTLSVYLGGVFPDDNVELTGCALFCDFQARGDELTTLIIPIIELSYVARVLGIVSPGKPWRSLENWKLPKHELALVKRIETELNVFRSPIGAFSLERPGRGQSVH
jgi:hypothetical protein